MSNGDYVLFLKEVDPEAFYEKEKRINKIKKILYYAEELSQLGYEDKYICKFIEELKDYFTKRLNSIKRATTIKLLKDSDNSVDHIAIDLKYYCVTETINDYKSIIYTNNYGLSSKTLGLYKIVNKGDYTLLNDKSFENVKNFFSQYLSLKKELDIVLLIERKSCLEYCNKKLFMIEDVVKKYKSYKRFKYIYNKIAGEKINIITDYVYSDTFSKAERKDNYKILDSHLDDLSKDLNSKNEQNIKIVDYMEQRMLRLNSIKPKNMTPEEEKVFEQLELVYDKDEFDNLYATLYTLFIDHIYNDEKIKNNIKTKKSINVIKRKIDAKFNKSIACYAEMHQVTQKSIRDYIYNILQKIIDDNSISFEQKAILQLEFFDFKKDFRVLNEAINGGEKVSKNNVYIPRLDNKFFDRRFLYNLMELTFYNKSIEINPLTNNIAQDGDFKTDYDAFIYQYMSIDTYIKNADYIGKSFVKNDFHNKESQDYSNSILLFNYNGILLIETNGEYEIASHEAITMVGYDIPEPDKIKVNIIETYKKEILNNIVRLAKTFRDERSPLNKVNPMKPILVKDW